MINDSSLVSQGKSKLFLTTILQGLGLARGNPSSLGIIALAARSGQQAMSAGQEILRGNFRIKASSSKIPDRSATEEEITGIGSIVIKRVGSTMTSSRVVARDLRSIARMNVN